MTTEILILVGIATAIVFVAVLLWEGAIRPGYRPTYHTGSALSLGDRGWIQIANFLQLGVGMLLFAAGVDRTLGASLGVVLLAIFALGWIASGVFRMDPMRGYPPGTPSGTPAERSWHHQIHDLAGPLMFFAVFGACLALAGQLVAAWRVYTVFTAFAGLALTISTAVAWQKDAAWTGLIQRGLIFVYLIWIALLGIHLV
jgi:hypothetical protein